MLEELNWTEIIVAGAALGGTVYGHWKTAKTSRDKTIDAVKEQIQSVKDDMKTAIQSVREEVMADRMSSKASDEEIHAELLLFKQESTAAWEKQLQATNAAIDKTLAVYSTKTDAKIEELTRHVELHNNVIDRTYKLEQNVAVLEEHLKQS